MEGNIREPKQKRAIEKKEKIIEVGFDLICKYGYHNINTAYIACEAGVSTGILYQYFKDKYSILIEGLQKYGDNIFFPILQDKISEFHKNDFDKLIREIIKNYVNNHKLSKLAHEEIMAMVHSDEGVAKYYYEREYEMTRHLKDVFISNGFKEDSLFEKVHIMLGIIDNLCHEIIYHKHDNLNYDVMIDLVVDNIKFLFREDLV